MVAVVAVLFLHGIMDVGVGMPETAVHVIDAVLVWIAAVLTAGSGIQYLWSYRHAIDPNK